MRREVCGVAERTDYTRLYQRFKASVRAHVHVRTNGAQREAWPFALLNADLSAVPLLHLAGGGCESKLSSSSSSSSVPLVASSTPYRWKRRHENREKGWSSILSYGRAYTAISGGVANRNCAGWEGSVVGCRGS